MKMQIKMNLIFLRCLNGCVFSKGKISMTVTSELNTDPQQHEMFIRY